MSGPSNFISLAEQVAQSEQRRRNESRRAEAAGAASRERLAGPSPRPVQMAAAGQPLETRQMAHAAGRTLQARRHLAALAPDAMRGAVNPGRLREAGRAAHGQAAASARSPGALTPESEASRDLTPSAPRPDRRPAPPLPRM